MIPEDKNIRSLLENILGLSGYYYKENIQISKYSLTFYDSASQRYCEIDKFENGEIWLVTFFTEEENRPYIKTEMRFDSTLEMLDELLKVMLQLM